MEHASDFGFLLWKAGGSLVLVLAVLLIVAFVLKRWGLFNKGSSDGNWIQILARKPLGPRHYLLLVQVQENMFLLGVSPEGIGFLSSLPGAATSEEEKKKVQEG